MKRRPTKHFSLSCRTMCSLTFRSVITPFGERHAARPLCWTCVCVCVCMCIAHCIEPNSARENLIDTLYAIHTTCLSANSWSNNIISSKATAQCLSGRYGFFPCMQFISHFCCCFYVLFSLVHHNTVIAWALMTPRLLLSLQDLNRIETLVSGAVNSIIKTQKMFTLIWSLCKCAMELIEE